MKVKCINTDTYWHITKDVEYEVVDIDGDNYRLVNDSFNIGRYPEYLFEVVEDSSQIENSEISDLDSKIKELKEQLDILIKAKEILEK